jgi:spermidine synthase
MVAGTLLGGPVLFARPADRTVNEFGETLLFRQDTQYHRITVTESGHSRNLRFDATRQSGLDLRDGLSSTVRYADYMQLAMALKPDAKRALVVGLGGGAIPRRLWHDFPDMRVDSVEIDPVVVDVARRYFSFPTDPRLRVFVQDGRRYVQTTNDTYDIAMLDAYYADSMPFHLTTREFFTELKGRMSPDGVVAYNVISSLEGDRSRLFRSLYRTAGAVWEHLWVFSVDTGQGDQPLARQNIIVIATDADVTCEQLLDRIATSLSGSAQTPGFAAMGKDLYTKLVPVSDVPLLTDEYAPTDSLIQLDE